MTDFKFNPAQISAQPMPKKRAVKSVPPATPDKPSDETRSQRARDKSIAWSKRSNASPFSFQYDDSHYQDFAGENTSYFDAEHWVMFAEMLMTPILNTFKYELWNHYRPKTGEFVTTDNVPFLTLADLKTAVKDRCTELGVSLPKLWEWFSVPDPDPDNDYGRKIHRESLDVRIKRWQVSAERVA